MLGWPCAKHKNGEPKTPQTLFPVCPRQWHCLDLLVPLCLLSISIWPVFELISCWSTAMKTSDLEEEKQREQTEFSNFRNTTEQKWSQLSFKLGVSLKAVATYDHLRTGSRASSSSSAQGPFHVFCKTGGFQKACLKPSGVENHHCFITTGTRKTGPCCLAFRSFPR